MNIRIKQLLLVLIYLMQVPFAQSATESLSILDEAALNELRDTVIAQKRIDDEFALERVLKTLELALSDERITEFAPSMSEDPYDAKCQWPDDRPKGVAEDEWEAVLESDVLVKGDFRCATYRLMDMDSDGKRDLLIDIDGGGTGLWRNFLALRRADTRFVRVPYPESNRDESSTFYDQEPTFGYSTNGRGANQHGYWIHLQNRLFLAFFDGHYGEDRVYLLRPFSEATEVPLLTVRYRYSYYVPHKQGADGRNDGGRTAEKNIAIDPAFGRILEKATQRAVRAYAVDSGEIDVPCPSPKGASDEEKSKYSYFGPGHYTIEIVAGFSFWWKKQCHIAELINWFGSYSTEEGLLATLNIRKPPEPEETSYQIRAKRKLIELKTSQGKFEFF